MASRIERIVSPSHRNDVRYTQVAHSTTGGPSVYTSSVTFKSNAAARRLDRDFVLAVQAAGLGKPRCVAEVDRKRNSVAMSLSLVPNFGAEELSAQEYVFIIDRSGSMAGEDRIMQAKEAMQILLKSLPSDNTYFNVVGFGSSYSVLWNGSQAYNYRNLKTAVSAANLLWVIWL
jgi:Mg-chelatase subunit ChlD